MATITPITHVFSEINEGKYASVKHYDLQSVSNGTTQLTEQLNISKNRICAQSMPIYWLKIRNGKKWSNCITGLFSTTEKNIYKGDTNKKKNLVLFKFSDNAKTLTVYYYSDFYTKDLSDLLPTIKD